MRWPDQDKPAFYVLMALMIVGTFGLDIVVYKGVVVWVLYFIPLALALFGSRPNVPLLLGLVTAVLTGSCYFISPEPPHQAMIMAARIDRSCGPIILIAFGYVGRMLVSSRVRLEFQQWVKAGQTELVRRMRGEQHAGELARNIVSTLAEYVSAPIASIYVVDKSGAFAWAAGYGADVSPDEKSALVRPGQTLVGQAAANERIMVVDDVPDGYVDVRSGLGAAKPRTLVLVPTRAEERVTGVIELGFFKPPSAEVMGLLEMLSESVGFGIRSMQYRERQAELLAETQQQAAELHAQQRELAASNEELTSQQAELITANDRLSQQAVFWSPRRRASSQPRLSSGRRPTSSSAPAVTSPSFWRTCPMSCAPRSTAA